jgi:hypothetical protein
MKHAHNDFTSLDLEIVSDALIGLQLELKDNTQLQYDYAERWGVEDAELRVISARRLLTKLIGSR